MNSRDYLNIEIKNLLAGIRPTQSARTLNPYAGGCDDCPFCGRGEGLYGGVANTWTQFQARITKVQEGQHLTPPERSLIYKSLTPEERHSVINIFSDEMLNNFLKLKKLQQIQPEPEFPKPLQIEYHPEERVKISTREPIIEEIKEALKSGEQYVKDIIREVEQKVPTEIVEELTPAQLETAKEVIAETYFECLKRAPVGHKRETCRHLTKKYIKEKLKHLEQQEQASKYDSWVDCMIANKGTKGIRKICHPYVKKKKYVQSSEQKGKYKTRQQLVAKKAKELKAKHPRKSYQERLKMARKLV